MTTSGNSINVPVPGSPRFEWDTAMAIGRIKESLGPLSTPAFTGLSLTGLTLTGMSGVLKATVGVVSGSAVHGDLGGVTANQHHNAVTLGTANGLTLSTQELSLPTTATMSLGLLKIGTTSTTLKGSHYLAMMGPAASLTAFPSFNVYTATDDYPLLSYLCYGHDNVQLRFDSFYDGALNKEISSSANSVFRFSKRLHYLSIEGKDVTAQGEEHTQWYSMVACTKSGNLALCEGLGVLGSGAISFGTGAVGVVSIRSGTAPSTSVADKVQLWSADRGGTAGKAGLHLRAEDGTVHVISDRVGIGTVTPNEALEVVGKIRANTAFNLNGTDGVTQAAAAGKVSDVTALAGGIATAQTQITYAANGTYNFATSSGNVASITITNGRITAITTTP